MKIAFNRQLTLFFVAFFLFQMAAFQVAAEEPLDLVQKSLLEKAEQERKQITIQPPGSLTRPLQSSPPGISIAPMLPSDARVPNQAGSQVKPSDRPQDSAIEQAFRNPPVPLGDAIGGSITVQQIKPTRLTEEEEQRHRDALIGLMALPPDAPLEDKLPLLRSLNEKQLAGYLQGLDPQERSRLRSVVGQSAPGWYLKDLQAPPVDRNLKQFGFSFFEGGNTTFLADPSAPVGPDYVVGPGDTFVIDLWGAIEGHHEALVDRTGTLTLPRVGAITLWGQSFDQAKQTIKQQVAKYYTNFEINITLGGLRSIQVFLVGEVKNPGTFTVGATSTLLNALIAAGGPSRNGSLRNVQLVRNGQPAESVDFYDFFLFGDRSRDLRLQSGDTVYVPIAGPQVGLAGDVRRPAIYELKSGETLGVLLELAGGFASTAYLKKVQIERVEAHRERRVIDLNLETPVGNQTTSLDLPLQDRDLVQVYSIAPVKNRYVKLSGYVARPGLYELEDGMRLSDLLLHYDNLLPYYYPGAVEILRLQPPHYEPAKFTVNLGEALNGELRANVELVEHDEIKVFSREEMEERANVRVAGAVQNPGRYPLLKEMTVRDLVIAAGNLKRGAFVAEAELTRTVHAPEGSETRQFLIALDKALDGDSQFNVALQADDQLFIRFIPDFSENPLVRLEGEVRFPGEYAIGKGEKLSSLIARAGGFTDKAYLRGASFNRESVRESQQSRFDDFITEQEKEIFRVSADIAGGALSREEIQSAQSLLDARKQLMERLKKMPITGRMVVRLKPLEELSGSEQDIELMDGDTLSIPTNPKTVTVLGEVYNPITLTFSPGKTVAYYLNRVGGAKEKANVDEMFVVRADGTVFSRSQAGSGVRWDSENFRWVSGGFNNALIYPGDTLLVPEKFDRIDIMREVKDLTQIFYQMALGAAAVASF